MEPHVHRIVELGNNKAKAVGPCRKTRKEYSTTEFNLMGYMSWILKEDKIQNCLPLTHRPWVNLNGSGCWKSNFLQAPSQFFITKEYV